MRFASLLQLPISGEPPITCVPSNFPIISFVNREKASGKTMGEGGGCVPSKKKPVAPSPTSVAAVPATPPPQPPEVLSPQLPTPHPTDRKVKVFVVFYSMYGHVESQANKLKKGVDSVEGVEGFLFRVPETLPPEVLEKMGAPEKDVGVPVIGAGGEGLLDAHGVVFGFPTSWTAITQLAHLGMLFVPIGYTFGDGMFKMDSIKAGTPYGAGVFAGDGSRQAAETELALAEHQGKYMASVVKKLALA